MASAFKLTLLFLFIFYLFNSANAGKKVHGEGTFTAMDSQSERSSISLSIEAGQREK